MSEQELDGRIVRGLHAPAHSTPAAKQAIMRRVRLAAMEGAPHRAHVLAGSRFRQGMIGMALAAGLGSVTTVLSIVPNGGMRAQGSLVSSAVIGDTVADRLRDTLRLVRLIFDDPAARQVAVVGDFNAWQASASPMQRDTRSGHWTVTLALRDGDHRYAIVADNARWPGNGTKSAGDGRAVFAMLHVAPAAN